MPAHQNDPTASRTAPAAAGFGAHIADPGPLGLAGFAGTTLFLSAVNAGLLPETVEAGVFGLAIFYGGIAQLLAGLWEFTKGNTFGATAFVSFGAFWLSFWYLVTHGVPALVAAKASPTDINHAVGTFLLVWTIFTAYMFIASLRTTAAIAAVFLALTLTFLFLCIGAYGATTGMTKTGGYLGLVTAALAFYGSFAVVTNSTFRKTVLPVVPLVGRS
ncbi:acetate uptake transporter [uncultured Jatrophihabitans sp.]|uniref:acetate uptake transporter n=1 Tax=uncultured Jatrophihabitans sp. TaxID=1610747 RepID=UPI0035C9B56B